jgi:uncharacterized protein YndB with AHSA1/START domain
MNETSKIKVEQTQTDITFTKIMDAPRALVFEAFSKPEHLKNWWGPKGWDVSHCTVDFRVGGLWRYSISNGLGQEHWAQARYDEIVHNERIVFTDTFIKPDGRIIAELPSKQVTVMFEDAGRLTKLKVTATVATAKEREHLAAMGFVQGFSEALGNLTDVLNTIYKTK